MTDSFKTRSTLQVAGANYQIFNIAALGAERVARLPYSLKILLENLLRFEDGVNVTRADIEALLNWDPKAQPDPRDLLHARARDPAGLHRRALRGRPGRDARSHQRLGGDAEQVNPLAPAELVIDHSVQVDEYGTPRRWRSTTASSSNAMASATRSCAGARAPSAISRWCRPTPASCTR